MAIGLHCMMENDLHISIPSLYPILKICDQSHENNGQLPCCQFLLTPVTIGVRTN